MALIANNISGSISNFSKIGITGSVVFANRPNSSFPTLPTDTTFYVSGSKGLTSNRAVFHGDVVLSGTTYVGTSEDGGSLGVIGHGGIIMNPYGTGAGQTSEIRFKELAANGGNYVALKAPSSIAANVSFALPSSDGSANHVIKTDGAGNLSFVVATTLVTPGGSDTQVQFNDGGSTFGGDGGLTYNKTTDALTIAGDLTVNGGDVITTNAASTVNLFNTNATTLNLAGAATTVEIGAATGTTSVNNSLTVDGKLTVTGGTTAVTDAVLGNAAVGSFPFYDGGASAGVYAMFGHKDLDHSTAITNYALYQDNVGNTVVNASNDKTLFLSVNNTAMGFITNNLLGTGIDAISLTGQSSTKTNMAIGNTASTSTTSIYAGSGGIILSGSGGSTVITGSTSTRTDAIIGAWEIGSLPATQTAFPNVYAFVGHKDLDHSADGNYALVQSNVGDTFLGAVSTKDIFFKNGTDIIGTLSNDTVSFTGKTTTATATTIGNTTGASSTTIQAGTGDIVMAATVRNSSQPSFLATLNAAQNNFATSTNVPVLFNSEIYDNANNFDVGSYTFTAPETGKYLFSVALRLDNVDTAADYYTLYLITSNRDYRLSLIDPGNFAADPVYWYLNGSAIADMDATDTAYVVIRQQVGTSQTDILNGTANSFFSGWFLG